MARLKADLEERLPEGSTREQAIAWFASQGLTEYGTDYGDIVRVPKDGEPRDGLRCGLWGRIPSGTLFENAWIDIEVYFDENDKVRRRFVERRFYSF